MESEVDLKELLTKIFLTNGRLMHHERVLCVFPDYLQMHFNLLNDLMNGSNVLPITHRYYLSIMAVSCYNCEYLLKIQEEQFVMNGGNIQWLQNGLKSVDPKLRHIAELNELLAHRCWAINADHIQVKNLIVIHT